MKYKKRLYKYILCSKVEVQTDILGFRYHNGYLHLNPLGKLSICRGYAWDGPSGPSIDTKTFMRGSLIHDAVYQLLRQGDIPQSYRKHADNLLYKTCLEDGMWEFRAWYVWKTVRWFAAWAARPGRTKIYEAP